MGNEPPDNFSLKDGYLRVAGVCGRAEYLEKIRHDHALGKLTLSGLPNGTGERAYISPLTLIDYRLAFGPDDAGCLAVHNNLTRYEASGIAGEAHQGGVNLVSGQMTYVWIEQRKVLAEGATEIDSGAYEAISGGGLSKPGEAPVVFTELHLHAMNPSAVTRGAYDSGERAKKALAQCFPHGIPSKEEMPDSELVRRVQAMNDELFNRTPAPDRKTILRHAERLTRN